MNQDFGVGEALLKLLFHMVKPVVRFLNGPVGGHPDVELDESRRAALARAQS